MNKVFLKAQWRKLAIANYEVDPLVLMPFLPYQTEIDLWQDKCYISLVGFMFLDTRLKGIPIPFHRNFEEINLRFYVRYKDGEEWKRGVTFIQEIVPKPALSFVANTIYKEKYITLPTRHSWVESENELSVSYAWRHRGRWNSISVKTDPVQQAIRPGSEEEFITEHYWGYTKMKDDLTSEYPVAHPRWNIYPVKEHQVDVQFGQLYGEVFAFLDQLQPVSVMLAEGSEIEVGAMKKIR